MRAPLTTVITWIALALPAAAAEPLDIRAANAPLAAFAAFIAGDAADVEMVLPEGADPTVWQPGIAELTAMQQADLILLNGAGFEPWAERVSLPRARVVNTSRNFADSFIAVEGVTHSHGEEPEHSHGATAPNTWLDFTQAAAQASAIAQALERARPAEASAVRARLQDLQSELAELDAEAMALGEQLEGRALLARHPGFEYFARRYGLDLRSGPWGSSASDLLDFAELDAALAAHPAIIMLLVPPSGQKELAGLAERGMVLVTMDPGGSVNPQQFLAVMAQSLQELKQAISVWRNLP